MADLGGLCLQLLAMMRSYKETLRTCWLSISKSLLVRENKLKVVIKLYILALRIARNPYHHRQWGSLLHLQQDG